MVLGRVDGVNTNDIDSQGLHERDIPCAALGVGKRVDKGLGAGGIHVRLVGDANNVKLRAVLVKEFRSLQGTRSASRLNGGRLSEGTLMETV
jgi:hypothetical protein